MQQQQYDGSALKNQNLTFETTIFDWRDICDLVETNELWKYLNYYFHLQASRETWKEILEPEDQRTLGDLCRFVSDMVEREVIEPIKIMGNYCGTAAIFKSLKRRLADRGLDVTDIRPSSRLEPLIKKYRHILIEEVNLLAPTVLSPIGFKRNWASRWGFRLLLTSILLAGYLAYRKSGWAWAAAGSCLISYGVLRLGAWLNPRQSSIKNIATVADLVRKIEQQKLAAERLKGR